MDQDNKKNPDEIGALWKSEMRNGGEYLSGTVNGEAVVCFPNTHKQTGDRKPDYRVMKKRQTGGGGPSRQTQRQLPDPLSSRPDDDIPF